jgi:hypothetical protein
MEGPRDFSLLHGVHMGYGVHPGSYATCTEQQMFLEAVSLERGLLSLVRITEELL